MLSKTQSIFGKNIYGRKRIGWFQRPSVVEYRRPIPTDFSSSVVIKRPTSSQSPKNFNRCRSIGRFFRFYRFHAHPYVLTIYLVTVFMLSHHMILTWKLENFLAPIAPPPNYFLSICDQRLQFVTDNFHVDHSITISDNQKKKKICNYFV